ncbi:MAG: SusC/RagA family TonB-linked outer membrane protein, partial [Odoribacter sp.]|nr:SusC/RagA family TonB-linked outer membrane protein [Odoribacter sp.]
KNWNMLKKSNNSMDLQNTALVNNLSIIGKPLNGIYVLDVNGYYNSQDEVPYFYDGDRKTYLGNNNRFARPGDRVIRDVDGNGRINVLLPLEDDRIYGGSPLPKAQGGFTNNLKWNGFDLNVHFSFMLKRHILNAGQGGSVGTIISSNPSDMLVPIFADLNKTTFWQNPGDVTDYPANRAQDALMNFATNLSSNIQNVSFLKLKSVSLGYTLPKNVLGFGARFFISAENIATFTNYKGNDPETVDIVTGIDYYNNYPLARKMTVGVSIDF